MKEDSFVSASGRVGPFSPLAAEIRIEHRLDVSALDERLSATGIVDGQATVFLRDSSWSGAGAFRSQEASYDSIGPLAIEMPWSFTDDIVHVTGGTIEGYGGKGGFDAALDFRSDRETFTLSVENLDPRHFVHALGSRVSGQIKGEAEGFDLATARAEGTLSLTAPATSSAGSGLPVTGAIRFRADSEAVTFEAPHLRGRSFALSTSGTLGRTLSARFSGTAGDLADVAHLLRSVGLSPPPLPLGGALDFQGTVSGPPSSPAIEASLGGDRILIGDVPFSLEGNISYRDSLVALQDVLLGEAAGGSLGIEGRVPLTASAGSISLEARADALDLSWASSLAKIPLRGKITAGIEITGPLSHPSLRGFFEAQDVTAADSVHAALRGDVSLEGPFPELAGKATLAVSNLSMSGASLPDATLTLTSNGTEARVRAAMTDGRELATARIELETPYALEAELSLQNLPLGEMRMAFPSLVEAGAELEIQGRAQLTTSLSTPD